MKIPVAVLRLAVSLAVVTAIVATFFDTASRATINPFNFFGFFTMQGNIITVIVLVLAALASLAGRKQSAILELARGCATTYMAIVGIVYNLLLAGLEGGVSLAWANWVLHVAFPIYVVLDWAFIGDRAPLPWRRFWVVLVYPIVWIVVVIIRGATDGWVPYPFLDPAQDGGYATVTLFCVGIAISVGVVAVLTWLVSRVRPLKI